MTKFQDLTKEISSEESFVLLEKYVELIEEKNKSMNLTGFSGDRLWEEGIYESIISLKDFVIDDSKLLDIGAGAGFPSVPFAIFNPSVELTIYEPLRKRIDFLKIVIEELGLTNIILVNERIENSTQQDYFDYATARAVAPTIALFEISHRMVKLGGEFVWIKGPNVFNEIEASKKIMKKLSIRPDVIELQNDFVTKQIYVVNYFKEINTPVGVPRDWSQIAKSIKKSREQ